MTIKRAWRSTAAMAGLVLLAGCDAKPPAKAVAPAAPPPPKTFTPPAVKPPAALTRAEILAAIAKAASDHAAGAPLDRTLAGRTFVLRMAFACQGPAATPPASDGVASATWSKDRASIRLSFKPTDWSRSPLVLAAGETATWDGVEGVWIPRPWSLTAGCPTSPATAQAPAAGAPALVASPMTAGLAAILNADGSRLGRREGEAYSFVVRGEGDAPAAPPEGGYRLVLEGRLSAFPDGAAIRCTSDGPDARPVCVAAVQLDVVAFETAAGARLSEWRPS